jgi:hypothetical protein
MSKKRRSTFKRSSSAPRSRSTVSGRYILRSDRQPVRETLYQLSTSKKRLSALPEDVRLTLILCGHIANEITTLHRLLLFTMKEHENPVLNGYADFQSWVIIRLLVGKVAEGVKVLQKRIFGQPFGRTYLPGVQPEAVDKARRLVGQAGLLRTLRNDHSFHYPPTDALKAAFDGMADGENWSMLMGQSRHSMFFALSHAVTVRAILSATGKATDVEAVEAIKDEALDGAEVLLTFFEQLIIAPRLQGLFDTHTPVISMADLPSALGVTIPPLCKDGA